MTKGSNERPVKRMLTGRDGKEYVVELLADAIRIRPKGTRVGGDSEVQTTPSAVYEHLMLRRAGLEQAAKPRALRIGRTATVARMVRRG